MPCGIRRSSYLGSPTRFFLLLASVLPFVPWTSLVITRFSLKFARTKHLEVSEWKKQEEGSSWEREKYQKKKERGRRGKRLNEGKKKERGRKTDERRRRKEASEGRKEREREGIFRWKRDAKKDGRKSIFFFFFFWANSFLARIHTVNRVKAKLAWVKWNTLLLSRDVVAKLVNRIHKGEWGGLINVGLSGDR